MPPSAKSPAKRFSKQPLSGYGPSLESMLTKKMAHDARLLGREAAASSYDERIRESRAYAETLRRAITQT
jgi:hypothetical protein